MLSVLTAVLVTACTAGPDRPSASESAPAGATLPSVFATPRSGAPTSTAASLVAAQSVDGAGATRLAVTADWMAVAGGSAWAAAGVGVLRIDGRDGLALSSVPVPNGICLGFDGAFGAIWAGAPGDGAPALLRIDVTSGKLVATIPLKISGIQCESSVGAGDGAVWLISFPPNRVLVKVDPTTNRVVGTFPMPPEDPQVQQPSDTDFGGVRVGYGGVWIADQAHDTVLRMSDGDGSIGAVIPLDTGSGPRFVTTGEGSVWALNQTNGTVSRIDPAANLAVATIQVSAVPIDGGDIAVGCGSVWARVSDELVARIDPATNTVIARYGPPAGSGSVACAENALWISAHDVNAIWRVPLPVTPGA